MKTKIFNFIIAILINSQFGFSQGWLEQCVADDFIQVDPVPPSGANNVAVCIGDFASFGVNPASALDVNTNFLPGSGIFSSGEVFRTNCPEDISTYWRMLRVYNGSDNEFGNIYSLRLLDDYSDTQTGEGFHFFLQSSTYRDEEDFPKGDIRFNTGHHNAFGLSSNNFSYPRMRILGTNGNVGIGDYTTFLPYSMLHIHEGRSEVGEAYTQYTNLTTLALATDGFKMGVTGLDANFYQQEDAPVFFYTFDNGGTIKERLKITYDVGQGWPYGTALGQVTKVNISYGNLTSPITAPVALLNLGENPPTGAQPGGQRSWMDVGTFNCLQSDDAYFGLKREGLYDHFDAVIGWGDNVQTPAITNSKRLLIS